MTVEDPCEGFQRLRDAVDLEWALLMRRPTLKDSFVGADVAALAQDLKLVPAQIQFIINTLQYRQLQLQQGAAIVGKKRSLLDSSCTLLSAAASTTQTKQTKQFRLGIKKQILKANGDLKGMKKTDMQKELEIMYKDYQVRLAACDSKKYLWE